MNKQKPIQNPDLYIMGKNPVTQALAANHPIKHIYLTKQNLSLINPTYAPANSTQTQAKSTQAQANSTQTQAKPTQAPAKPTKKIPITITTQDQLDQMAKNSRHGGIIAVCPPYTYTDLNQLLANLKANDTPPFLILLDKIQDPHNLGAIIRTAHAAGVHGIIIPKNRAVGVTSAVASTAQGSLDHVPIIQVTNMTNTIETLKSQNIWVYGADMSGNSIYKTPLKPPIALVIGNEGAGLARLVKEKCDLLISLPMAESSSSLNASVAAALCMYEVVRAKECGHNAGTHPNQTP